MVLFIVHEAKSRLEGLPNAPYSPRRGESAKQRARDRGGIGVLGMISGNAGSRFIKLNFWFALNSILFWLFYRGYSISIQSSSLGALAAHHLKECQLRLNRFIIKTNNSFRD